MPQPTYRRVLIRPLRDFLATESAGGVVVVVAAFLALLWANSPWRSTYQELWLSAIELRAGALALQIDLRQFVNEALMAIFFLVVGLEIKREVVEGELRDPRHRSLPVFAAIGGMILPALIYAVFNIGQPDLRGWGIPTATDIALAVGVMSLAPRVSPRLKVFLLALAIVDDIGAILLIGLLYSGEVKFAWLAVGGLAVALAVLLQRRRVTVIWVYVLVGCGLWVALHEAGVHATLTGVIMGLLAPTKPYLTPELIEQDELINLNSARDADLSVKIARHSVSVVEWLEHRLHRWTSYVIVPVFALANAGVVLSGESIREAAASSVAWGVALGLLVGKPIGVLTASAIAIRVRAATLPAGVSWTGILGAGLLAGMGFTVSLFITQIALSTDAADHARLAIVAASILAASAGLIVLRRLGDPTKSPTGHNSETPGLSSQGEDRAEVW
jgi:NhaA family Na+:H+ antiporter